ncbi:MAG: site-2 protease family protein, partial [Bdellovibrionota bacterium]
ELGHAVVAQSLGVRVRSIILMMLGGIAEMERIPEKRYAEFKVAIAGPAVSFGLAALLFIIKSNTDLPELVFFSHWLGRVNLVLGIFNVLPAFPMDGGRILRSIISARKGALKATQLAVSVGKAFAWVFGIIGFLQFNILLMLIAFFIYTTAQSEMFLSLGKDMIKGIRAGDIGVRTKVIDDSEMLSRVVDEIIKSENLVFPVSVTSGESAVVGIEEIKQVPREKWSIVRVRDVMEKVPKAVDVSALLEDILSDFAFAPSGVLPLYDHGVPVGIIRYSDLMRRVQLRLLQRQPEQPQEVQDKAA